MCSGLRLTGVRVRDAGEILVLEAFAFKLSGLELVRLALGFRVSGFG